MSALYIYYLILFYYYYYEKNNNIIYKLIQQYKTQNLLSNLTKGDSQNIQSLLSHCLRKFWRHLFDLHQYQYLQLDSAAS